MTGWSERQHESRKIAEHQRCEADAGSFGIAVWSVKRLEQPLDAKIFVEAYLATPAEFMEFYSSRGRRRHIL